jgi:hypothetical protein
MAGGLAVPKEIGQSLTRLGFFSWLSFFSTISGSRCHKPEIQWRRMRYKLREVTGRKRLTRILSALKI